MLSGAVARYWAVNGGGHKPELFSDEDAAHSECESRNFERSELIPAATMELVDLIPAKKESRPSVSGSVTSAINVEIKRSFDDHCRKKNLDPSKLLCALIFDFLHARAANKPSAGSNLLRNLEQFESARQRRRSPGRLKRRKRRLAERLKQLVTEVEAVFVGLDDGESSPVREEA